MDTISTTTPHPTPAPREAVEIGIHHDKVVLKFAQPVGEFGLSGAHAMELAVALMKHARRVGVTQPVVWRIGE